MCRQGFTLDAASDSAHVSYPASTLEFVSSLLTTQVLLRHSNNHDNFMLSILCWLLSFWGEEMTDELR